VEIGYEMQLPGAYVRTYKNHVNSSADACISGHIKLEHVITCTFGCTNGEMHVESFSDVARQFLIDGRRFLIGRRRFLIVGRRLFIDGRLLIGGRRRFMIDERLLIVGRR
jgi:hypothetical protein